MFVSRSRVSALIAAGALFASLLAPPAQASGPNSGGLDSGGGPAPTGPCTLLSSYNVTTGYYKIWAATWASFTLAPCQMGAMGTYDIKYHNDNTGQIDYEASGIYVLATNGYSATIDDDFGPFNTTYTVTLTVTDANGVQTSRSSTITTKSPKSGA
jgi:hypothetical protein